jgi:hypothetical protein
MKIISPLKFFSHLQWIDRRPLLDVIEPYRQRVFMQALYTFENGEHPKYIQSQMGHSSIKVTTDTYGHLMQATKTQAAEKLATLALGSKTCSKIVATRDRARPKRKQVVDLIGGPCWNRTSDPLIKSQMLCRLS